MAYVVCRAFARAWPELGCKSALMHGHAGETIMEQGVAMVQGASRGLGFEFVRQLLLKGQGHVIATCRNPRSSNALDFLRKQFSERLTILPLDVTDEGTVQAAARAIKEECGRLDLLINTSGVLHIPDVLKPETSLSSVDPQSLLLTYQVNAAGPILVIKHMLPLLNAGGGKGTGRPAAVVANLSARVGSIGDNQLGGWYGYRASKTALNQLTKTVSVEFQRKRYPIICILLHPGTVDTALSKPFQKSVPQNKLFSVPYSVEKLLGIIDKVDLNDNGKFFGWDSLEIPW